MKRDEKEPRRLSPITRGLAFIAGAEADTLEKCPLRDVHNVMTIAFLLLIVWVWQSVLFTMVGHMMLARQGEWRPEVVAGAILIATVVLLVDSYVIVRSSWSLQGLSDLKRGGLEIENAVGSRVKNGIFIFVRLVLSTVLATLTALFLSILLFEKDITANLEQQYQKANGPLLARVTNQVDGVIAKLQDEHEEARGRLATLADEEKLLRGTVLDPTGNHPEFKAALDRVAALQNAKVAAQSEVKAAEDLAADELGGTRRPGTSGVPGYGSKRRAADEKIASAKRKMADVSRDIAAAEKQVETLRETLKDVGSTKRGAAENKLGDIATQRKDKETRFALVETDLRKRQQNREQAIRAALEADPGYRPRDDGFLARLEGLERISEQFHVKFVVIIFHIGLFGVELAAVLAKIATFIPSSYATVLACQDYRNVVVHVRTLVDDINSLGKSNDGNDPPEGAPAAITAEPPEQPKSRVPETTVPQEAADIGDALRKVFPQRDEPEGKPPHNDTAFRKRGRPGGRQWRPWLKKEDGDKDQSVEDRTVPA